MFGKKKPEDENVPPHMMGPPVEFKAMGGDDQTNQGNLIQVRQSMGIVVAKETVAEILGRRADRILLDYTRDAVGRRFDVDGVWLAGEPLDRQRGDLMLAVFKKLANLNVADRQSHQRGRFGVEFKGLKYEGTILSQGTPTGERAIVEVINKKQRISRPEQMGMRDKMFEKYKELVAAKSGLFVVSAPANHGGLSTTWTASLGGTDRYMRDFIAVYNVVNPEGDVENVDVVTYDGPAGETPSTVLPKILLKQPEVLAVPEIPDAGSFLALLDEIYDEEIAIFTSVRAKDSAEAALSLLLAFKPDVQRYAQALKMVLNTRLVRRLCEKCRQPYQPPPQLLQRLGIPPGRVGMFYREWQPPQEARKRGGEPEICPDCGGLGYRGRIAVCELMEVTDPIREVIIRQPQAEAVRQASRQAGNRTLQEEAILLVATGITSLTELQRAMQA